jgi:hypothetical protein
VLKDLSPGTPIFSLAAQMSMQYQAVDHNGVTMLGRIDTADSVVFKIINIFIDVNIE